MALRIGFDLDGVLADMELALEQMSEKLFRLGAKQPRQPRSRRAPSSLPGTAPAEGSGDAPPREALDLTDRERRQLWRHVHSIDGFWETLEETEPGVVARLAALASERQWEIIFLTRRPQTAGATSQLQSQRWLESKGFRFPSVYVVTASRGLIAAALTLDIVVDDTPENCVDVASDSKARTIAVIRNKRNTEAPPPAGLKRMGIHMVRSTEACLDLLVQIDSSVEERPGAMERVMRTLGLKQPVSV